MFDKTPKDVAGAAETSEKDQLLYAALASFVESHREEKKASSRRKMAMTVIMGIVACSFLLALYEEYVGSVPKGDYVALVRMQGEIGSAKPISAQRYAQPIAQAFKDERAKGVVLVINSPGGQPAQSQLIHDQIRRMADETGKKVVVVGEDQVTSGAYLIAVAADEIYAPTTSVVGSIGVVSGGFDITELADRYGVRDRTFTAGTFKDPVNPLKPVTPEAQAKVQHLLDGLHQQFIGIVEKGRGERLAKDKIDLYTGEAWMGTDALALGLIDGHLDLYGVAQSQFGVDNVRPYQPKLTAADLIGAMSPKVNVSFGDFVSSLR